MGDRSVPAKIYAPRPKGTKARKTPGRHDAHERGMEIGDDGGAQRRGQARSKEKGRDGCGEF